jgi:hypothetical protein
VDKIDTGIPPMARPPREWELQTAGLMVAVVVAAVLCMLFLVTDLALRSYLLNNGADGMSPLVTWVGGNYEVLSGLLSLLGFAYIIGFIFWRRRTKAMLQSVGVPGTEPVWHWTVAAWYFALGASFMIRLANNPAVADEDDLPPWLVWDAAATGARLVGLGALLIAVWQIRVQVRATIAEAGVILRINDIAPRRSAVPLLAAARPAPAVLAPDNAADDDFWRRVSSLATGRRTEIALLETTDGYARRWFLVPASGQLDKIRSLLTPGAVVTAFPEPPAATETKGFSPRPADEYHGFLDDGDGLRYQSVRPSRVGAFLAQARRARRWALYPATAPEALSAVV